MITEKTFLSALILLLCINSIPFKVYPQAQLQTIVPLAPEAAALSRFGNVPVGLYTGVPHVSIPIYSVETGVISLPLSLDYHAGGNKVETVASWAGLGWALSGLPVITRSVRGRPDAGVPFSYGSGGYTVEQLYYERFSNQTRFYSFITDALEGVVDSEADMFYYTINGANGKFYFKQDLGQFVGFPESNIRVTTTNGGADFLLVDQAGVHYHFDVREITNTAISGPTSSVTSAWYPSRIVNAQQTDTITFTYGLQNITTSSVLQTERYQYIAGSCTGILPADPATPPVSSTIAWRPLERIGFKSGYVDFIRQNSERLDWRTRAFRNKHTQKQRLLDPFFSAPA